MATLEIYDNQKYKLTFVLKVQNNIKKILTSKATLIWA